MITFVIKQEEPCEARVSSTVPWECKGEIPSHDPIIAKWLTRTDKLSLDKLTFQFRGDYYKIKYYSCLATSLNSVDSTAD